MGLVVTHQRNQRMPNLDEVVRVRVPRKLKERLARIANSKCKSIPEATREAVLSYVQSQEQKNQAA